MSPSDPSSNPASGSTGRRNQGDPWRVEGSRGTPGKGQAGTGQRRGPNSWLLLLVVMAFYALFFLAFRPTSGTATITLPYSAFTTQVQNHNVASITATGNTIDGTLRHTIRYHHVSSKDFATQRPIFANDDLFQKLLAQGATVGAQESKGTSPLLVVLIDFGPMLLIFGAVWWYMRRAAAGGGAAGLGGLGKARATRYEAASQRTTFADVAGIDEATDELAEIVDFLKQPDRYRALGAQVPRGVLLTGPPGTGKTLLARAVAGEADVPFFSISAAEFIEMIVGVGASRVRDLFDKAKKEAPSIIFIDELDSIGRSRAGGMTPGGAYDEREQTLNQVLTEMDGFTGNEGVIVLAATNRPEILDAALLRPGRFDRRIAVNPPDRRGREQILKVHTRSIPLAENVDLAAIAASTPGMVGADLRNLVNEAALLAARRGLSAVGRDELTDSLEKIMLGAARRILISPQERERTAYHEAGHALIGMLEPGADPIRKISIIPRGHALGVTFQSPDADRYGYDDHYLRGRITGMLGGRAAEEVVYGAVTNGAESDLEQATALAREMVGRWGMSEAVGLVTVLPPEGSGPYTVGAEGITSERTRQTVDDEVRRIADECHLRAVKTLNDHRHQLDALAKELLAHETLDEMDAYAAAGIAHSPATADDGARA